MDKEILKEKINYQIHLRNTTWTTALLVAGGTASLILRLHTLQEIILFIIGIIVSILFFNGCFKKEEYIESLIDKMENQK